MTLSTASTAARIQGLTARLYQLHVQAGDTHLELWPDDDVLAVIRYARTRFHALPLAGASPLRREQLLLRMELTRLVSAMLDAEQLELLDQARPRDVRGQRYPVSLKELAAAMGVGTPSAVSQRHNRLLAAVHNRSRTPQEGRRVLAERAARTREQFLAVQAAQAHHMQVYKAARALLDVRDELTLTEEGADWLHDLEQLADEELRPEQMSSFAAHLSLAVAEVVREDELAPHVRQRVEEARTVLSYRR